MRDISLLATKTVGLDVAGVDLMAYQGDKGKEHIVVLEVNDGPGTKTFDKQGLDVSGQVADYFVQKMLSGLDTLGKPNSRLQVCR